MMLDLPQPRCAPQPGFLRDWPPTPSQSGFVLVAVLVVVMLVSMVAVSVLFRMRAEESAAAAGTGLEQAWSVAMSGVYHAIQVAAESAPGSLDWMDNPDAFKQQLVWEDGVERWYFTVYTMGERDGPPLRYGLTAEASRINLNEVEEAMLTRLPRMTAARAQALLDYMDADDTARPEGAEQDYYNTLAQPYRIANGALTTLDEMLLVRDFTPALFYGEDANLNFQLEPNEDDGAERFPPDDGNGELDRGQRHYLTIYSYDLNLDNAGQARTNLNDLTVDFSESGLPEAVVGYIEAMQTNDLTILHPAELYQATLTLTNAQGTAVEVPSEVGEEELRVLLDKFTATDEEQLPGLIDLNTASAQVLQTLPGMDLSQAEAIVAGRLDLDEEMRQSLVWLLEKQLVDADRFKRIAPYLTTRSWQFRFHVIGYALPSGQFRVLEAVVDLAATPPAISYLRDLTRLGLPFNINLEISEADGQSNS